MKSRRGQIGKRLLLGLCVVTVLIWCIVVFCHSCTSPDAVFAATTDVVNPARQIVIKSPVFTEKEEVTKPEPTLTEGNVRYHLVSTELTEVPVEGTLTYVSASIPYELEWEQNPPESTVITLYDEQTEIEFRRELSYIEMKEIERSWEKTFSFPITVSGYDAEHFQLGSVLIRKDEDLVHYADQILKSIGLSEDFYRINTITWTDESYEKDGEVFRDALAEGEKLIRHVDVKYGGEIKTPDSIGYQYISVYEIPEKKETVKQDITTSDIKENAEDNNIPQQQEGMEERILRFLQEHMTIVTVGGLLLLLVVGVFFSWYIAKRRMQKQKSKELT